MSKSYPIVIVGNGGAAIQAIKSLRACNYEGDIHLFTNENCPAYNPMLTSYYVAGKIPQENLYLFGNNYDFYKENNVNIHLDEPIVQIDAINQTLTTAKGNKLGYSKCLIATGAAPFLPPIPGIKSKRVHTLRTVEDANRIKQAYDNGIKKVLIVGASMVGIKLVEFFAEANIEVCLADQGKHVFPLAAHTDCAKIIENCLSQRKIKLRLGAAIQGIEETHKGIKAYFSNDDKGEEANIVIMCIGARSNLDFLDSTQVKIDKGVIVDDYMQTNVPNLYAAGDVAQGTNLLTNTKEVIALWANACYQGRTAGKNMAGLQDVFPGNIPHNITHFMNMVFVSIGNINCGKVTTYFNSKENTFLGIAKDNDRIVGINILNNTKIAGVLKQIVIKHSLNNKYFDKASGAILWDEISGFQVPHLNII